jgi:hypothetical protein
MTHVKSTGTEALSLYAENWPAADNFPTTGLDRALVPIVDALGPLHPTILLAPRSTRQALRPLHTIVAPYASSAPFLVTLSDELLVRSKLRRTFRTLSLGYLQRRVGKAGGVLLSVLGGDPESYVRAAALAHAGRFRHLIYAVDDPFAWAAERSAARPQLCSALPQVAQEMASAAAVVAITPDLAEALTRRLGRKCYALPLPYISEPARTKDRKRQLIFIGNMSHLYADSFFQIVEAVRERRARGDDLKIIATFLPNALPSTMAEVPDFVELGRINDRKALLEAIATSLAAICPIAFDPAQSMVRSSFPSKLLDYLAHARAILVHGPADSIAARYLMDAGLPFVTSDKQSLDDALELISTKQPDSSSEYRALLDAAHGAEHFREKLLHAMQLAQAN